MSNQQAVVIGFLLFSIGLNLTMIQIAIYSVANAIRSRK